MHTLIALLAALAILSLGVSESAAQPAPRDADDGVLSDAEEHLYAGDLYYFERDYYRAITEYKSFLREAPTDARRAAVELKIAWIYERNDKHRAAAATLHGVSVLDPPSEASAWAHLYLAQVAAAGTNPLAGRKRFQAIVEECAPVLASGRSRVEADVDRCVQLTTYARLGLARYYNERADFAEAAAQLSRVPERTPQREDARRVAHYVGTLEIPRKSPTLAGALSVVPGLGHFYLEEWGIGAVALVWNGAFIYATAESALEGSTGQAILLGLLESIWYVGTVFGAVAGAHRFNRDADQIVQDGLAKDLDRMDDQLPWPARFPAHYPAELKVQF